MSWSRHSRWGSRLKHSDSHGWSVCPPQAPVICALSLHRGPQRVHLRRRPVSAHRHLRHAQPHRQHHHHPQRLGGRGRQEVPRCLVRSPRVLQKSRDFYSFIYSILIFPDAVTHSFSTPSLLQLRDQPEDQRDQLRDGTRLPRLRLLHRQSPQPQGRLPACQVSGHHHALCEEPARREHNPQGSGGSRSVRVETHARPTSIQLNSVLFIWRHIITDVTSGTFHIEQV